VTIKRKSEQELMSMISPLYNNR